MEGDTCWEGLVDDALAFLEEFGGESGKGTLVSHDPVQCNVNSTPGNIVVVWKMV